MSIIFSTPPERHIARRWDYIVGTHVLMVKDASNEAQSLSVRFA